MMNLSAKRILITGGAGFLGRHVVRTLERRGCKEIIVPRQSQYNLTREEAVVRLYHEVQPAVVIHLAASVGGIGINAVNPGRFFYENLVMGAMMMEYARRTGVEK